MARAKKGLGKGLDALFEDNYVEEKAVSELKISEIEPNSGQPRNYFDDTALRELADSIRSHGVLQPLVVRPLESGGYQIVAGERRWRASRMAGLTQVPVVIRELNDLEALEIGIIENLQREDLNPVELALGYKALMDEHDMTQEQVAEKVGKSRPVIANTVRLLNLPNIVLQMIEKDMLTTGHAKALLALEDPELIMEVAERVAKEGLLVRDVEKIARTIKEEAQQEGKAVKIRSSHSNISWGKNAYLTEVEVALRTELSRKVKISGSVDKGTLLLEFYGESDLEDLAARLTGKIL